MAAAVEMCKPAEGLLSAKEPRPKRDFLREHREYLRNIQKGLKSAKAIPAKTASVSTRDTVVSTPVSRKRPEGTLNDTSKSEASNRSSTKVDRSKPLADKRFGTFISRVVEPRKRAGAPIAHSNSLDEYVQTCDPAQETFLEGAKILTPSDFVLEAIRAKSEPPPPPEPKPRPVRRRLDRHACALNAHLSDLKEFLESGSVSRRKRNESQKNPNIQKYLERSSANTRPRSTRPIVETKIKQAENTKSSILFGAGESVDKSVARAAKQPRMSKKEAIGDGPKHSESNKLIVVYQKE